jgi:uncharacterized peroxidase-related enzyme
MTMTYLDPPAESPLYDSARARLGRVPNYVRVFALRPDVYRAWLTLSAAVRAGLDERRYELVTLAAARRLGSRYCALAHAAALRERFYSDAEIQMIVGDRSRAGLDPADLAAMDFAEHIAADPRRSRRDDIERLRAAGLSDVDIFEIVLTVALRRFFAGVLDATGTIPDDLYEALDPALRAAVTG